MKENPETPASTGLQAVERRRLKVAVILMFGSKLVVGVTCGISWLTFGRGGAFFDTKIRNWMTALLSLLWLFGFVMLIVAVVKLEQRAKTEKHD